MQLRVSINGKIKNDKQKLLTYLFLAYKLEYLHKPVDHLIKFQNTTHKFLKNVQSWFLIDKVKSESFPVKHHVHLVHQDFKCTHYFFEMLVQDGNAFFFLEFSAVFLVQHFLKACFQIFDFLLAIYVCVFMHPTAISFELMENWGPWPISIFQYTIQLGEVALLLQILLSLVLIRNLLTQGWYRQLPVQIPEAQFGTILMYVSQLELIRHGLLQQSRCRLTIITSILIIFVTGTAKWWLWPVLVQVSLRIWTDTFRDQQTGVLHGLSVFHLCFVVGIEFHLLAEVSLVWVEFLSHGVFGIGACCLTEWLVAEIGVACSEVRWGWFAADSVLGVVVDWALLVVGFEDWADWLFIADFSPVVLCFVIWANIGCMSSQLRSEFVSFTLWAAGPVRGYFLWTSGRFGCPFPSIWIFVINSDLISLRRTPVSLALLLLSPIQSSPFHFLNPAHLPLVLEVPKLLLIVGELVLPLVLLIEISRSNIIHTCANLRIGGCLTFSILPLLGRLSSLPLLRHSLMLLGFQLPAMRVGIAVAVIIGWVVRSVGVACVYATQHLFWLQLVVLVIWVVPWRRWEVIVVHLGYWLLNAGLVVHQVGAMLLGLRALSVILVLTVIHRSVQRPRIHLVLALALGRDFVRDLDWHICQLPYVGPIRSDIVSVVAAHHAFLRLLDILILCVEIGQFSKRLELAVRLVNSLFVMKMVDLFQYYFVAHLWSFSCSICWVWTHLTSDGCLGLPLSFHYRLLCIELEARIPFVVLSMYVALIRVHVEFAVVLAVCLWMIQTWRISLLVSLVRLQPVREDIVIARWKFILIEYCLSFVHLPFWIDLWKNSGCSSFLTIHFLQLLFHRVGVFDSFVWSSGLIRGLHQGSLPVEVVHHNAHIWMLHDGAVLLQIRIARHLRFVPNDYVFKGCWARSDIPLYHLWRGSSSVIDLLHPSAISVILIPVVNMRAHLVLIMRLLHVAPSSTMRSPVNQTFLAGFKRRIWRILVAHLLELLIQFILIDELLPILPLLRPMPVLPICPPVWLLLLIQYIFEISLLWQNSCMLILLNIGSDIRILEYVRFLSHFGLSLLLLLLEIVTVIGRFINCI